MNLRNRGVMPAKFNFLIFISALTGQIIAEQYFFTSESGVSVITALAAVIGFNIGNIFITKTSFSQKYDERDYRNLNNGLAWGFIASASMLGVDLASAFSWSKPEILIISAVTALLVMVCRNFRQTEGLWKKFINGWKQRTRGEASE